MSVLGGLFTLFIVAARLSEMKMPGCENDGWEHRTFFYITNIGEATSNDLNNTFNILKYKQIAFLIQNDTNMDVTSDFFILLPATHYFT